jgi:hypothetical protein
MAFVFALVSALERLRDARQHIAGLDQAARVSTVPGIRQTVEGTLNYAEKQFQEFELDAPLDRLGHVRAQLTGDFSFGSLATELRVLNQSAEDQMTRRHWVYVPLDKTKYYLEFLDIFPLELALIFPEARHDIREACYSYALDRNTACVFHSMGILQCGLYDLAKQVEVPFQQNIELENWKNIIDQIESKLRELEKLKRGKEKDEKLSYFSNMAVQFRYFKDAWRNHVAHFRENYDADQAHSILIHVRDFMQQLAAPRAAEVRKQIEQAAKDSKSDSSQA